MLTFAPGFPGQRARVVQMLAHKAPGLVVTPEGADGLRIGSPWPQFSTIPIGLDSDAVHDRQAERPAGRAAPGQLHRASRRTTSRWELAQTKRQCADAQGIGPVIFAGSSVLGNRGLIKATADALDANGLTYGSVELGKTFGDEDLSRLADAQTVRVHSIGTDEMGSMDEPTAVERFVRAAKERNIRVCYVRLFTFGLTKDADVIHANTEFVGKIVKGMREARLTVGDGPAHPYADDPEAGPGPARPDGPGRGGRDAAAAARLHGDCRQSLRCSPSSWACCWRWRWPCRATRRRAARRWPCCPPASSRRWACARSPCPGPCGTARTAQVLRRAFGGLCPDDAA